MAEKCLKYVVVWLLAFSLLGLRVDMENLQAPRRIYPRTVYYPRGEELLKMIRSHLRANLLRRKIIKIILWTGLFYFFFMVGDMVQGSEFTGVMLCNVTAVIAKKQIILQTPFIRVSKIFSGKDNGEEELIIEYLSPHRIVIKAGQEQFKEAEIIRLCRLQSLEGKKFMTQAAVGQAFNLSRQMINRRKRVVEQEDLVTLLLGEYEKSKLTPKVKKRILDLVVSNWHITPDEIAHILVEEGLVPTESGLVNKISAGTVRQGIQQMDGLEVVKRMRQILEKGQSGPVLSRDYLIDRLLELVKQLLHGKSQQVEKTYQQLNQIREQYPVEEPGHQGPYQWNQYQERVYLQRDKRRKKRLLEGVVNGEIALKGPRPLTCPDCGSEQVTKKEERPRNYTDENGDTVNGVAVRMRCQNEACRTKTFTLLPSGLELWARVTVDVKRKALKLIFHVRGSYRRGADYLREEQLIGRAWTTLLNWIRKVGQETIELERIFKIRWSGKLVVDEKWIKLFKDWVYLYVACDGQTGEVLHQEVFMTSDKKTAKTFLLQVKALGYIPDVVITDLSPDYDTPVAEVFEGVPHHRCVFHAERAAKKLVNKYLSDDEFNPIKEKLKKNIRDLFKAKTAELVTKRFQKLKESQSHYPQEAAPVFSMLENYYPILLRCKKNPDVPATSNAAEHAIKEFDIKYQNTFGYSSIYAIKEFVKAYTIYQRLHTIDSGPNRGRRPREIAQQCAIDISWEDYLLAT